MFFLCTKGTHYPISQIESYRTTYDQHSNKILKNRPREYNGTIVVQGRTSCTSNDYAVVHPSGAVTAFEENYDDLRGYLAAKEFDREQTLDAVNAYRKAYGGA